MIEIYRLFVDEEPHIAYRTLRIDRQEEKPLLDLDLARRRHRFAPPHALDNLVDVDVPPTAGCRIDDFNPRLFAAKVFDVPSGPVEPFRSARPVVRSRRGANRLPRPPGDSCTSSPGVFRHR